MIKHWFCHCGKKNKVGVVCACDPEKDTLRKLTEIIKDLSFYQDKLFPGILATEILERFDLKLKGKK